MIKSPLPGRIIKMDRLAGVLAIILGAVIVATGVVEGIATANDGNTFVNLVPHAILVASGIVVIAVGLYALGGR